MNSGIFKGRFHMDHTTDGTPCWCKKKVAVTINGTKVGDGIVDPTGGMTMTITNEEVAKMLSGGEIQHLSINPTYKP